MAKPVSDGWCKDIREPISQSESAFADECRLNSCNWSGATPVLFGLIVALILILVAVLVALLLSVTLKPEPEPWLPELVRLIVSVDTRIQRLTFLVTAVVFAGILAVAFFFRLKPSARLSGAGAILVSSLDRGLRLTKLANLLRKAGPNWGARGALFFCCAIVLAVFTWGQIKISTYTEGPLRQAIAGDPHIYAIFGRAGEELLGRFTADASGNGRLVYGFGPAALYALGRSLGAGGGYYYSYQIARWSNLVAVMILFWALFRPHWSRLGNFSTVVIVHAALIVAIPLLLPNGDSIYAANLSGLRYIPVMLFIIGACVAPKRTTWTFTFVLSFFVALGFVYAMDIGIISLIGCIVFVGLDHGKIHQKLLRVLALVGGSAIIVVVIGQVILTYLSVDLFGSLKEIFVAANSGFGGMLLKFNLLNLTIITMFVVIATALMFISKDRPLDKEERFVTAIAVMGFVWYYYYLHRPGYVYWIYSYLALFNLRYVLGLTSDWRTRERRVGAALIIVVASIITLQNYGGLRKGFKQEFASKWETKMPTTMLSGIRVAEGFGKTMDARMSMLDRLRTKDCVVVTGFPYLVMTATRVENPPYDIVFGMTTEQVIDSFVSDILKRKPSRVILEPEETAAWGPALMNAVVGQIERKITPYYKRDDSIGAWRVWNLVS
jgi:hypothetical protein